MNLKIRSGVLALAFTALTLGVGIQGCTKKTPEPANTVHVASVAKIKGLDPALADDLYAGDEVGRVYEGLLQYHYLKRPYVLIPNLAESMPEVSKDGKVLKFKIKKGVLFQDDPAFKETGGKGRELTADDFIYSWKRLADPKTVSTGWWIFDGKIVGLNEWRDAASKNGSADYAAPVEGLKALDRYTLQVTLTAPSAQFLYMVAMPFSYVMPKEAVDAYGKEIINHAVGTGPFRLTEYSPGSKLVWDRNPTFRKELYPTEGAPGDKEAGLLEDAGQPLPRADRIVVQVFEESQPQWLSFMAGKLDLSGIPKDNYNQAVTPSKDLDPALAKKGIQMSKSPELDVTHISFNMLDPVVGKNKYLRQALSLAYDIDPVIDLFYNGRALAAQGPIPPGIEGYDPSFRNPYRQFNLAKAKELMAKAGYPDGKGLAPLEYLTLSDSTSRQFLEYDSRAFAAIGVKLAVRSMSWPELTASIRNRKGQLFNQAWSADYPDAENFLQLFYSKNVSPGPNDSNYTNPEFDKLYEKALTMQNSPARTELYKKMVAMVVEDCPWIFGVHRVMFSLWQPWTKNYKRTVFSHGSGKYLRIDTNLRK